MTYIYIRNKHKWYNESENEYLETFDSSLNKYRIKIKNRWNGLNHHDGYAYVDPGDIKFIWKDGSLYGEYNGSRISGSFNISKDEVVDSIKKIRKLVQDEPKNVMRYIMSYAEIFARDYNYCKDHNVMIIDRERIFDLIETNILGKLTEEQLLIYELNKSEIDDFFDFVEGMRRI